MADSLAVNQYEPEVSVIIAAYNAELFVEKAIYSALNQIGVKVEVIVVDDASLDKTADVVAAIDDSRVTLLRHEKNQWAGAARNTGINRARGEWLAILDSDDEFELNRLIKLKALAEQSDCQVVCDNLLVCTPSTGSTTPMFSINRLESIKVLSLIEFIEGNLGGAQGYTLGYFKPFMRRAYLEQHAIRYPTNMNLGEDYFILADLLASGAKCVVEPHPHYRYASRSGSMSHRLAISDTDNILREGKAFEQRHTFDSSVIPVLKKRHSYVSLNRAFLRAIHAIKTGAIIQLLGILVTCPKAIIPLLRAAINKKR